MKCKRCCSKQRGFLLRISTEPAWFWERIMFEAQGVGVYMWEREKERVLSFLTSHALIPCRVFWLSERLQHSSWLIHTYTHNVYKHQTTHNSDHVPLESLSNTYKLALAGYAGGSIWSSGSCLSGVSYGLTVFKWVSSSFSGFLALPKMSGRGLATLCCP